MSVLISSSGDFIVLLKILRVLGWTTDANIPPVPTVDASNRTQTNMTVNVFLSVVDWSLEAVDCEFLQRSLIYF